MVTRLVIGDYSKSSWSLRAWLILKAADVSFDTVQITLERENTRELILQYSPSGKVPALIKGSTLINDSLAIAEYAAETYPLANLWPEQETLRAMARSASAEMHSGFVSLRTQMSFGLTTGDTPEPLTAETEFDIQRIFSIWKSLLTLSGSTHFLCGSFGIVDAMFVPVVFRFRRYGIPIPSELKTYVANILEYTPVRQWLALATQGENI
ncbi:MAG: putative glutathione S-transferase [Pseudomonas sp.]|nr:putative glutathione S-transferase [Pseudomonas sp.]